MAIKLIIFFGLFFILSCDYSVTTEKLLSRQIQNKDLLKIKINEDYCKEAPKLVDQYSLYITLNDSIALVIEKFPDLTNIYDINKKKDSEKIIAAYRNIFYGLDALMLEMIELNGGCCENTDCSFPLLPYRNVDNKEFWNTSHVKIRLEEIFNDYIITNKNVLKGYDQSIDLRFNNVDILSTELARSDVITNMVIITRLELELTQVAIEYIESISASPN